MRAILCLPVLLLTAHAVAQEPAEPALERSVRTLAGSALPLDGNTLWLGDESVRLFGIDSPEITLWPWGPQVRAALDDLVDGKPVTCLQRDTGSPNGTIVVCRTAAVSDLGEAMLRAGHATVRRASTTGADIGAAYEAAERAARRDNAGIWSQSVVVSSDLDRGVFERFQNIIAAFFALGVAFIGARAVVKSANRQFDATIRGAEISSETADRHRVEDAQRRQAAYTVALAADLVGHYIRTGAALKQLKRCEATGKRPAAEQYDVFQLRTPETFVASWVEMVHLPFDVITGLRLHVDSIGHVTMAIATAQSNPSEVDLSAVRQIVENLHNDARILRDSISRVWPRELARN